ncbi:response regulator transcription factor [Mucilaginibacter sp. ZT4R22]|uniref:Response regulator transcription factor n=1 Tax=Mucilaginibacter pankratovii TaxID=2772110 RepID=A0ABR7WLK6_9SPHI|nr:response regulator transcription factor [Mucilaginibacter pankratovii]MBD1363051.1 response regulator transcription factor [Mucilaginibacter pankratovii]
MLKSTLNIILADDHLIVRGGIKSMLEKEKAFQITGEANNGAEVLSLLENGTMADIILVDMNMPVMGGIELTERLKADYPKVKAIMLSALDTEKYVIKAFKSGACGYLLKSVSTAELIFAIRHTHEYGQYICAELSTRFLTRLLTIPDPITHENVHNIEFSTRDIEILTLLAEGYTNQEIGDKLFTSKRTIENHRQQLIDKTDSRNTIALIRFAMLNGVI